MKRFYSLSMLILMCFLGGQVKAQQPAFPGAEGGGMYTTGGRGGTVYFVNTLDDTNTGNNTTREGSLRWCVGRSGKRTIVFKVSGIIELTKKLDINNGDLTIAGQTAPGDGICIKNYEVVVKADNVIIRYLRFRLGDEITTHEPDALWGRERKNIIIDHCSISWSIDETASFYSNEDFTMQWCYITESLTSSIHDKGNHGYGGIWGGKNASFHHNLLAHHDSRNPRLNGWKRSGLSYGNPLDEERVDYRNNVIYNWGNNSAYGGEAAGKYNMVANYYKAGPATASSKAKRIVQISIDGGTTITPRFGQFYITDNYVHGYPAVTADNWNGGVDYDSGVDKTACKATQPFACTPISQHTAEVAFDKVLDLGGASLARDAVDTRIAGEVRNGTYTYTGSKGGKKGLIDSQQDVGGWPAYNSTTAAVDTDRDGIPDAWETANGLNPNNASDGATVTASGYTNLELYLNSLVNHITAQQLAGVVTSVKDVAVAGKFRVYPNPSSGRNFKIESLLSVSAIRVYDMSGRLVTEQAINSGNNSFSLPNLSKGVYLLSVKTDNNTWEKSIKLVLN